MKTQLEPKINISEENQQCKSEEEEKEEEEEEDVVIIRSRDASRSRYGREGRREGGSISESGCHLFVLLLWLVA
ncbi:hypothetical protein E2C01_037084 [Portunus trituberculatus]|uniref:Uncharacterized protein n=1 Tax=Portunus trituberculatus TaxID=210409 RepID=A0A5B7FDP1_PORTR|nr:hypothetical protein [Portunus trituberculatus]